MARRDKPAPRPATGTDSDAFREAKSACLRLLALRPRTRADLAKALARKEFDPDVAEQVLDRLEKARLIDDSEYAEMVVRSRHTYQGLGKRALRSELLQKGVERDVAEEALAAIDGDAEEARARKLVQGRLRSLSNVDPKTAVRRLVSMLARKGYSEGVAYAVVRDELATAGRETTLLDESPPGT